MNYSAKSLFQCIDQGVHVPALACPEHPHVVSRHAHQDPALTRPLLLRLHPEGAAADPEAGLPAPRVVLHGVGTAQFAGGGVTAEAGGPRFLHQQPGRGKRAGYPSLTGLWGMGNKQHGLLRHIW